MATIDFAAAGAYNFRMPMPQETSGSRIKRSTTQVGLPTLILEVLAVFDIIKWNAEQTAAVLALATFIVAVIMNLTSWGRSIFAPDLTT